MDKKLVFQVLKPHKKTLLLLAALQFLRGAAVLAAAAAAAWLLDGFFLHQLAIKKAVPGFVVLLFVVSLRALLQLPAARAAGNLSLTVQQELRNDLHAAMLRRSPLDTSLASSGDLLSLALEGVDALDEFFLHFLPQLMECLVLLPLFLLTALWIDPLTALIFLCTAPIAPFLLYLIGQLTKEKSRQQWLRLQELSRHFAELLRGLPMLKLFQRNEAQQAAVTRDSEAFRSASLQVLQLAFVSAFALELITTLSIAILAVSIGLRLLAGQLDFFPAFFLLLLAPEFYLPLRQSGAAFHAAIQAHTAASSLQAFLAAPAAVETSWTTRPLQIPPAIAFSSVHCRYPGQSDEVLRGLSFQAKAANITLLTGPSGAGKSTVLALLLRQLAPTAGSITIGGLPLQQIADWDWLRHLAFVPQEPHIFQASLRENITLAGGEATDAALETTLQTAGLSHWLASLPQGLDTKLGEGQRPLSTGQRRRLGLARALWRDTAILLLDEITAGLDPENEQHILQTLQRLSRRKTILMTAHRPTVLAIADQIISLEDGKEARP